ncbi:hypothetical protein HZA42_00305 [Candidatus Peregrinibacteria bacterium]|nr:hypothetical protein [Candidatus Peregrinibacteria bacterium]
MSTGAPAAAPTAPSTTRDWQKTLLEEPAKKVWGGIKWISSFISRRVYGVLSETASTITSPITTPISKVSAKVATRLGYTGLEQGNIFDKIASIVEQTLEKVNGVLQTTSNIALDIATGIPAGVAAGIIRTPNKVAGTAKALIFGKPIPGISSGVSAAPATPAAATPPADTAGGHAAPAAAH